jgi:hypothetical protein
MRQLVEPERRRHPYYFLLLEPASDYRGVSGVSDFSIPILFPSRVRARLQAVPEKSG